MGARMRRNLMMLGGLERPPIATRVTSGDLNIVAFQHGF